jgi:ornithine cyclodeaminase/alanine dehydrogenase-like protein (mu-crystallin family)
MITRRTFIDSLAAGATGLALTSTARSYSRILGANDRLNFAVIGLNGRGYAHLSALKANKDTARLACVCDVESNILAKFAAAAQRELGEAPTTEKDFRKVLAMRDIDAITTGMRRWRSWEWKPERMFTWKSHAATIPPRASCW